MSNLGQWAIGLFVAGVLFLAVSTLLLGALARPGTQPLRAGHVVYRNLDQYVEKRHHRLVKGTAAVGAALFAAGAVLIAVGSFGQ